MAFSDDQVNLTHTKKLGCSQFQIFCKSQPQLSHWIFSIQKYLKKCHPFYYNSLLSINKGRSIQTIQKRLKNEFEKLTQQKSIFQIIQKSMIARQKCIQKIKKQLTKAERVLTMFRKQYLHEDNTSHTMYLEYVQNQGYTTVQIDETIQNSIKLISTIFIDMSRLRDMTIYIVETIHKWKVEIEQWADKCNQYEPIFFVHNSHNVYDKIMDDTQFIWKSALSQYVYIDSQNDPFMVRNVIKVEERPDKTILQKYFVQLLYPKSEEIFSKSVKCYEMLTFKYQPQINNLYRQQELLIENYLSLKKNQQQEEGIQEISQKQFEWEDKIKKQKSNKLNSKGWIFGKILKKASSQKVKELIERHQQKLTFIKPFNIENYSQKNSLALAYIGARPKINQSPQSGQYIFLNQRQKDIAKLYRTRSSKVIKREMSLKKVNQQNDKGYKSESEASKNKLQKMYQSLSKLNPVIMQDPRQQNEQTPKHKSKKMKIIFNKNTLTDFDSDSKQIFLKSLISKKHQKINKQIEKSLKKQNKQRPVIDINKSGIKSKLNTFQTQSATANKKSQQIFINNQPNIKIKQMNGIKQQSKQKEQQNLKDFIQNVSINTNQIKKSLQNQKQKNQQRKIQLDNNQNRLLTIRQLIQTNRINKHLPSHNKKSTLFNVKNKSPYTSKRNKISNRSTSKNNKSKSKIINQETSFNQYNQVPIIEEKQATPKQAFKFVDDFIVLTSKSIPIDIVPAYLKHLFSQIHSSSKKFTLYSEEILLNKLQDPYTQCIIFEVSTQNKGHVGQVILSEIIGSNNKIKYTIQFINIHMFQFIVAAILRIAEQLLYATPCEQVICPLFQDKLDPVSTHFIQLIENAFKSRVSLFGQLSILQKKKIYYKETDLHERLYIFSSNNKKLQEMKIPKSIMGNYRSLKFECKCLMLSSNFRMRSKSSAKNVISSYKNVSLGFLYRKVLQRIITKHHLKQMKVNSVNSNQSDQTTGLLKQNSFLRSSMSALAEYLKQQSLSQGDYIYMTRFTSMSQVLTYLDYKEYSQYFHFSFLQESRFILNHQLFLTQIEMDLSIQFMVRPSIEFLILYNHHNLSIKAIQPNNISKAKAVILPTTQQQIQLILIDGRQYELQTTDKLDLFSYLYIYQHNNLHKYKQIHDVKEIVIPMIQKSNTTINNVKMFDGFFRLFPQRQFYSGAYFKCTNLWESYFPSAVIQKPKQNSIVFQYPLIVGFLHKKRKQILTAFLLKNTNQ